MSRISLLAMAPSGEVLMVRDKSGRIWLIGPRSTGAPSAVTGDVVERAITYHGFERIEEDFESWTALEEFRQRRVARLLEGVRPIDWDAMDHEDIQELLGVARRWAVQGDDSRARRLALELLDIPAVRADGELHGKLVAFLRDLDTPSVHSFSQPSNALQVAARNRLRETMAA